MAVSYGMGWKNCATGKIFYSMSGHGYMIRFQTCNIISFIVKSKTYSTCARANTLNITSEEHRYRIKWEGESGGVEDSLGLELCIQLYDTYEFLIYIEYIVSDNYNIICSLLEHECTDKGKLPPHISTPGFLAYPSHHVKVVSNPICKLWKTWSRGQIHQLSTSITIINGAI